ncbi:hypothetical protein LINPERHAP1_LOCUS37848, partial [Linum perenne]
MWLSWARVGPGVVPWNQGLLFFSRLGSGSVSGGHPFSARYSRALLFLYSRKASI